MESLRAMRLYVSGHKRMDEFTRSTLLVYANEIGREVEELRDRDYRNGREDAGGAAEFADRLCRASERREDVTLWGVDYMPLPLDFEDEPIRVGDWVDVGDGKQRVEAVTPDAVYWWEEDGCHWVRAHMVTRHHRAPTVEDVLAKFAVEFNAARDTNGQRDALAECAAKLRLAGEE